MVIDSIIIKKGINYLLSDGKSATAKNVYYLHSRSVSDRRHSLKLTLKFRYGTFSSFCVISVGAVSLARTINTELTFSSNMKW